MRALISVLLLLLSYADLLTANRPPQHFATTPPQVFNFLLRPHRFPLSSYSHPWSIQHHDDLANLTLLKDELFYYDTRVRRDGGETRRGFDKGMKRVVRVPKWKSTIKDRARKVHNDDEGRDEGLLGGGKVGRIGGWVGDVILGGGEGQRVEFVLDMLSSDFVVYSTTSGGAFERGVSDTYLSMNTHITNNCVLSSDHLTLPHWPSSVSIPFLPGARAQFTTIRIPFTHCIAHRATSSTLLPSGAVWGLAFPSLSHNFQLSPIKHLQISPPLSHGSGPTVLKRSIWSFATVSANEAIFTLGGTVVEFAPEKEWRWTELKNQVEGYWEINMQSVLVEGGRVLRTIPRVVIDFGSPLIIGPGEMVEVVWNFVEGARRLWELDDYMEEPDFTRRQILEGLTGEWWGESKGEMGEWWVYPCLNEPLIQLEFAGWGFPVDRVGLGKVREGSGYCLGSIVGWPRHIQHSKTTYPRSYDEKRVWILGGPFWSGVVGVFDLLLQIDNKRVGMRTP